MGCSLCNGQKSHVEDSCLVSEDQTDPHIHARIRFLRSAVRYTGLKASIDMEGESLRLWISINMTIINSYIESPYLSWNEIDTEHHHAKVSNVY